MDETRLLIAPCDNRAEGHLLSLRNPKSGRPNCYLLNNAMLQELHCFKQSYTSWFVGDYVSQDGSLYYATQVDPVFVLLPIFEEARMKKGDDLGKFRQLDEILCVDGYVGYWVLMPVAEECMRVVCEIKEIGPSKFFRLDDSKVFAWLLCKVAQLKHALPLLDKNYAAQDEKNMLANAVAILAEYLKDEPWMKFLCDHFELNLTEAPPKVATVETLLVENNPRSTPTHESRKRSSKQAKRAKVDTESQNIREMFSRACRRI